MIRLALIALSLAATSPSRAKDAIAFTPNMKVEHIESPAGASLFRQFTVSGDFGIKTVVRLYAGACLRGPMTLYDRDGWEAFRLAAGVSYPAGCER